MDGTVSVDSHAGTSLAILLHPYADDPPSMSLA